MPLICWGFNKQITCMHLVRMPNEATMDPHHQCKLSLVGPQYQAERWYLGRHFQVLFRRQQRPPDQKIKS